MSKTITDSEELLSRLKYQNSQGSLDPYYNVPPINFQEMRVYNLGSKFAYFIMVSHYTRWTLRHTLYKNYLIVSYIFWIGVQAKCDPWLYFDDLQSWVVPPSVNRDKLWLSVSIGCPFTDTKQQPAKQGRDLHKNSGGPRANDVQAKGLHEVYSNLNYHNFKLKKTFWKTNKSTLFLK